MVSSTAHTQTMIYHTFSFLHHMHTAKQEEAPSLLFLGEERFVSSFISIAEFFLGEDSSSILLFCIIMLINIALDRALSNLF